MTDTPSILIIEDSPGQALKFQLILQREGYHVQVATDGAAGWRFACQQLPQAILLDIDLPGMDGFQILVRLKRSRATAGIPVVMLTHREHISNVIRAIDLGAAGYLFKDDIQQNICVTVKQLLDV